MKKSSRNLEGKLNNRGFSLVELIVVIAVMIALVGAVIVSSSILDSSYARDAETGIKDYIVLARSKCMSVVAKEWFMTITKDGDMYVARLCKTVADGEEDVTTVVDEKELGNKVVITFGSGGAMSTIDAATDLKIYFKSSTGSVSKVLLGGVNSDISDGIGHIGVKCGTYEFTMKVFYNTGKCERE